MSLFFFCLIQSRLRVWAAHHQLQRTVSCVGLFGVDALRSSKTGCFSPAYLTVISPAETSEGSTQDMIKWINLVSWSIFTEPHLFHFLHSTVRL